MKKFKFRLEKVREHRDTIKQEKKRELMTAIRSLYDAHEALETLEASYRGNTASQGSIMASQNVLLAGLYGERLKDEIISQRETIARAEREVEERRVIYTEASREAEVLESLKRKSAAEYQEMVDRELSKELDEISVLRAGFNKKKVMYDNREKEQSKS